MLEERIKWLSSQLYEFYKNNKTYKENEWIGGIEVINRLETAGGVYEKVKITFYTDVSLTFVIKYDEERLEEFCERAVRLAFYYMSFKDIFKEQEW